MSAKIISFINSKGGVAKTTSAVNFSAQLRIKRKRVLLVDMDPQADATFMFNVNQERAEAAHVGHALMKPECFEQIIQEVTFIKKDGNKKQKRDIFICPAHATLNMVENHLLSEIARENRLFKAIETVKDQFDYIIIDCPPDLGVCMINALVASDYYVLVVDSEPLAMKNMVANTNTVSSVRENLNNRLELLGVLFTKFSKSKALHKKVAEEVSIAMGGNVFKTRIPDNVEVAEAVGMPICSHKPRSQGNLAYAEAADEMIKRIKKAEAAK